MSNDPLIQAIKETAMKIGKEEFTLSSGEKSNIYIDIKKLSLHHFGAYIIADNLLNLFDKENLVFNAIGGPETGANAIIGAVQTLFHCRRFSYNSIIRGFTIKKESKTHGIQGWISGDLRSSDTVVMIEDVTTTAASLANAIDTVIHLGLNCRVVAAISVVDRSKGKAEQLLKSMDIPFFSLVKLEDLEK